MMEEDEYNQAIAMLFGDDYNSIPQGVESIPQTVTQTENITPSQASAPKGGSESMQYAFNYLQQKGIAPHIAAGIVGNFQQESDVNPRAVGDQGTSRGIAQWHNQRWTNLVNSAKNSGADPHNLEFQLDYAVQEAQQMGVMSKLNSAKNSEEAAYLWAKHFEKPKVIDKNRAKYAKSLYKLGGEIEITEQEYLDLIKQGYNITTL